MYAVVDTETTGLVPQRHDRIAEIAVVLVDDLGRVEGEWSTLINPQRDLGPQHIHRIMAKDILSAPKFEDVAGHLIGLLAGRTLVAHNLIFDLMFLRAEYERLGVTLPLTSQTGLCTMTLASSMLPGSGRGLVDCCGAAGVPLRGHHAALVDARATASLLGYYLGRAGKPPPWAAIVAQCLTCAWPTLPARSFVVSLRPEGAATEADSVSYVAELISFLPRVESADPYLAVLDQALSDRYLSADEVGALSALAHALHLDDATVTQLHVDYLDALARIAMSDQHLSAEELSDLRWVADALGLGPAAVDTSLLRAGHQREEPAGSTRIQPGDMIVFTGDMVEPREIWMQRARDRGYIPHTGVTKQVALVVAADPDSLSGKARKARGYGIPIMSLDDFRQMLVDR